MKHDFIGQFRCWALLFAASIGNVFPAAMTCDLGAQETMPATSSIAIWPDLAPGETGRSTGTVLPSRPDRITRVENVAGPMLDIFPAERPNGMAILVLPGGGFKYVVPDLEGSELAPLLNPIGVTVFVLRYRVSGDSSPTAWQKPVQDSQRAMCWIRANAAKYSIDPQRVGLLGFSAGGQAAAWHVTRTERSYAALDDVDAQSVAPDFLVLVYPWQMIEKTADDVALANPTLRMQFTSATPKTLIISTSDDQSADSRGAAQLYLELVRQRVDTEMHIYRTGGHGYGVRQRDGSFIHQWPTLLIDWLQ